MDEDYYSFVRDSGQKGFLSVDVIEEGELRVPRNQWSCEQSSSRLREREAKQEGRPSSNP